jgi:hypothetical protein
MLEKVKFQYILLSAVELPFACFSIHLKGESEIAYVRASILVLSMAYAIEDLFCVTHSGIITRNIKDFRGSKTTAFTPAELLARL